MTKSVLIGTIDQIPLGEGRSFLIEQEQIAVFRTHAGEFYATQASCPHRNGPLADGLLGGTTLVCPLHDRTFDLKTGEGIGPDCASIKVYPVSLSENAQIFVTI